MTASFEQEEVSRHSFLDFLSTGMLVQKIATKGATSVYLSHMKKTPSVLMYIELKLATVFSHFISVYSIDCVY
jgi:hypothetical protein